MEEDEFYENPLSWEMDKEKLDEFETALLESKSDIDSYLKLLDIREEKIKEQEGEDPAVAMDRLFRDGPPKELLEVERFLIDMAYSHLLVIYSIMIVGRQYLGNIPENETEENKYQAFLRINLSFLMSINAELSQVKDRREYVEALSLKNPQYIKRYIKSSLRYVDFTKQIHKPI